MAGLMVEEIDTCRVERVEAVLRGAGAPSSFSVDAAECDDFSFRATVGSDGELMLARYDVSGAWSLRAEPDLFLVATASSEAIRWSKGDERGLFTEGVVHFPPGRNDVRVHGSVSLFEVQFTPRALRRLGAEANGVEFVRLGAGLRQPRNAWYARYWPSVLHYAQGLFDAGLLANHHLLAALKTNLALTMLEGFALVEDRRPWLLSPEGSRSAFRRAVEVIVERAGDPIGAIDVAAAVGVPLAVLDGHFRVQTGLSIAEYLRKHRVIAAHTELLRAEPGRGVAEAVVRRWGFTSLATYLPLHAALYPDQPLPLQP